MSQPAAGETELLILATLASAGSESTSIAQRLARSPEAVDAAISRLLQAGLVEATGDSMTLTQSGRLAAANVQTSLPITPEGVPMPTIDLSEVTRLIGSLWPSGAERTAAEKSARDGLLASDADRDTVVSQLSDAVSQGRLSSTEFEQRTDKALAARTYGELDQVLQGLAGLPRPVKSHPVRKVVFWMLALVSSPFVLAGSMFFAFGNNTADHLFGLVFLILLLPGLLALRRWAWPRS